MKPHFKLDSDRDGIVDFKDCRPFNPRRQHISKTMKRRLSNLDIVVSSEKKGEEEYVYHIATKEARRKAPKATAEVFSVASKHPSIVGKMERLDKKKPITWMHVGKESIVEGRDNLFGKAYEHDKECSSMIVTRSRKWLEEDLDKNLDMPEWEKKLIRKSVRDTLADTTHHELRHIHQIRLSKDYPEIKRTLNVPETPSKEKDEYWHNINEIDARVYARKKVDEVPAGKGKFSPILNRYVSIDTKNPNMMKGFRRLFDDYY